MRYKQVDQQSFGEVFSEFLHGVEPKMTEHFADLTPEELDAFKVLQSRADALDLIFKQAMAFHTEKVREIRDQYRVFWKGLETRLGEDWPKNGSVRVDEEKIYRTPTNKP